MNERILLREASTVRKSCGTEPTTSGTKTELRLLLGFYRTLKTHENITAYELWTRLNTTEKAAFLANCGQGAGTTWDETAPEQRMLDGEWRTAVRRRLRLCVEECRTSQCGILKDEKGDLKSPWRTRINDRARDGVARHLRRKRAIADMERVAPQWSTQFKDKQGRDKVQSGEDRHGWTSPPEDQLQHENDDGAAKHGGFCAFQIERERKREITKKYTNSNEIGPDLVKPVSFKLGGRAGAQTTTVPEVDNGGELDAAMALRKLRLSSRRKRPQIARLQY